MAITRTAKGTAQSKTSNTTLTLASVAMTTGHLIIVSLAYDDQTLNSVTWGSETLNLGTAVLGAGVRTRLAWKVIASGGTQTVTATWASNLTAKAMAVTSYSSSVGGLVPNQGQEVTNTGSGTSASTSASGAIVGGTESILAGIVGTEGPNGDTAGTWSTPSTNGQRLGSTGNPAAGNVTVSEGYQLAPSAGSTPALSKTGMTSRDWGAVLQAFYWAAPVTVTPRYGQANARIKSIGNNSHGQTQATLKGISRNHGQAQATITTAAYVIYYNGRDASSELNPTLDITGINWAPGDLIVVIGTGRDEGALFTSVTDDGPGEDYGIIESYNTVQAVLWGGIAWAKAEGTGTDATITIQVTEDNYVNPGGYQGVVIVAKNSVFDNHAVEETGATDTDTPSIDITTIAEETTVFFLFNTRVRPFTPEGGDNLNTLIDGTQASSGGGISSVWLYNREEATSGSKNASGTTTGGALDWLALAVSITEDLGITTYRIHGQAQASIKQSYIIHGQAQAAITLPTNTYGQAGAVITYGITSVIDTFTRSVSDGLGTADVGGDYTLNNGTGSQWDVDGSKLIYTASTTIDSKQQLRTVYTGLPAYEVNIDFRVTSFGDNTGTITLSAYLSSPQVAATVGVGVRVTISNTDGTLIGMIREGNGNSTIENYGAVVIVNEWWHLKGHIKQVSYGNDIGRFKVWKDGDTEPGWTGDIGTWSSLFKAYGVPALQIDAGNTTNIIELDNFYITPIGWVESGQAQAIIKGLGLPNGQANASIKATYDSFGQAQAELLAGAGIYSGLGQAQAKVNAFNVNSFGQAQAKLNVFDFNNHGQAQARIFKQIFFDDFNRTVADGFGTASNGFEYRQRDTNGAIFSVTPSHAIITGTDILEVYGEFMWERWAIHRGIVQYDFRIPQITDNGAVIAARYSIMNTASDDLTVENVDGDPTILLQAYPSEAVINPVQIPTFEYDTWYRAKYFFSDVADEIGYLKFWKVGDIEPNWQDNGVMSPDPRVSPVLAFFGLRYFNTNLSSNETAPYHITNIRILRANDVVETNGLGQAQAEIAANISTYNIHGQAQAQIKQIYNQHGQAQSWIEQTYYGLGQAQAWVENTYNGLGQAQGTLKNTYYGLGQAQADIKQTYFAVAQTQADIKQTYIVHAQAQAQIKNTYNQHGQTQGWIKQIYNQHGQAQATIQGTEHGQAQAQIKQTYYGLGQAQADIKQTYNIHGQANALISQTSFVHGQTQGTIKTTYNTHGQAQAQIKQTYNSYGQAQGWIENTYVSHGQAQGRIEQTYFGLGQAQANIEATYNVHGQANANIEATTNVHGQAQADIKQTYNVHAQAQAQIKQVYYVHAQANSWIEQTYFGLGQAQGQIKQTYNSYGQAQGNIKQTYYVHGQAQALIKNTYFGLGQTQASIINTYFVVAQAQAKLNAFGINQHGQAEANIKFDGNAVHGQAQARLLAFDYPQHGQAQGSIRTTYNSFGQAQATVLASYVIHGQTQGWIENTYYGLGQANASILATTYIHGQANAYIIIVDIEAFGQAQAQIKNTYFGLGQAEGYIHAYDVNSHGQSQAYITAGLSVHGQAQGWIEATSNAYGQGQGWIETTYNQHGQGQADIKQTYNVHGQANALIVVTAQNHGQAQGQIKTTYNAHGQAQGTIEQTYNAHGQAQGDIKQTYTETGQANALIGSRTEVHGQAQATIETVYYQHGQSQANIEQVYNTHGQAQGLIRDTYESHGQATAYIIIIHIENAQAQAHIKSVYQAYGQAQAQIQQTYVAHGNAQSTIETTINIYAQAQGTITTAYFAHGQAEALITSGTAGHGQALAQILQTYVVFGQSEAFISKSAGYGQARATITVIYFFGTASIDDDNPISLTLVDLNDSTFIDDDNPISLTLVDLNDSTFNLDLDDSCLSLQLSDINY